MLDFLCLGWPSAHQEPPIGPKRHTLPELGFHGQFMQRGENTWWVYVGCKEQGGQEIIKNKLMRGIHCSINVSNVPRGQSLEKEMEKSGTLARMKMSGREDESRRERDIMMNQRGGLGLLPGCEIEACYFNTSKLTIKTEWGSKC